MAFYMSFKSLGLSLAICLCLGNLFNLSRGIGVGLFLGG